MLFSCFVEWHQYDGNIAKKPSKGLMSGLKSGFLKFVGVHHKQYTEQMKLAAKAMLPDWEELYTSQKDRRAESLLEKLDQVCYCVKNCFVTEDISPDSSRIKEVMNIQVLFYV